MAKSATLQQQTHQKPDSRDNSVTRFHSKFGGLWIDRHDFPEQLQHRIQERKVPQRLAPAIREFERNGIVVLEQAASEVELARFEAAISNAFREGHSQLLGQQPWETTPRPLTAQTNPRGLRLVDCFAVLSEALDLLSSPRLVEFLEVLFDESPKLFQSLSFDMGSEQGLHQDTAYVVVNRPMELVGCWVALEDVRPGSGELLYLMGSHRFPDFDFGGEKKHWSPSDDALGIHDVWARWLIEEGQKRSCRMESFLAKRGDMLIWHADLAHGGAPITNAEFTRKSLVGHFCPASAEPAYVKSAPARAKTHRHRGIEYCSWHYDLAAGSTKTLAVAHGSSR